MINILFFISLHTHGRGGHLYSLYHIAKEISKKNNVAIISIGPGDNSTIASHPNYLCHIESKGTDILGFKDKCYKAFDKFDPDIIHCFDVTAFNLLKPLCMLKNINVALTKCGGPNPRVFPRVDNLILFSIENKEWFESNVRYLNSNISFIPNRVSKIQTVKKDVEKPKDFFNFVKIARIGVTYKRSILKSINLIDKLCTKGLKVKLFVIGVVESQDILFNILSHKRVKDGTVTVLTDSRYTKNASEMLYLADASIATGRGVMEAASIGLPVLTDNSISDIPTLLTEKNFETGFKTNFSGRNIFVESVGNENMNNIIKLVEDELYYTNISEYILNNFSEYFDVKKVNDEYERYYKDIKVSERKFLILDSVFFIKSFYGFYKNYRK